MGVDNVNTTAIGNAIRDLIWRTNYVMAKFGFCSSDVRAFMFRTYCTSYYGSPLWQLDSNDVKRFYVTWRNCIRKIWGIPRRTHCRLLNHLCEGFGIEFELMSRFMSFYHSISKSDNVCTQMCSLLCKSSRTPVSINRRILLSKLNDDGESLEINKHMVLRSVYHEDDDECRANGFLLKELCQMRDSILVTDLNDSDISHLIDYICTG